METDELLDALADDMEYMEVVLPTLSESEKGVLCHFVALKLLSRFEQTGSMDDLNRAITTSE